MKLRTKIITGVAALAAAGATVGGVQLAQADPEADPQNDSQAHYYVEIGGTGGAADAPGCTTTFDSVNEQLGGFARPVCYDAAFGPFIGPHNEKPAPTAKSYDDSVNQGVQHTIDVINDVHSQDPGALITVTGYSQGADVGDRVLEKIANGEVNVPKELVSGKLYADPRQPGTGVWSKVGNVGVPGVTSPGAGREDFAGIPVERHCLAKDLICDAAATVENIQGYFEIHPKYPEANGIIAQTLTAPAENKVIWH